MMMIISILTTIMGVYDEEKGNPALRINNIPQTKRKEVENNAQPNIQKRKNPMPKPPSKQSASSKKHEKRA